MSALFCSFCKSYVCLLISGFLPSCGLSRIVDTLPNESCMTSWCSMSRPKMRWSLLRIWVSGLIQANRARWAVIRQPPSSPPAAHLVQDYSSLTCYPWIVHITFPCPIPLHCWDRQHKVLSPKTNRAWWCGSGGGGDLDGGGGAWWWWCQQGVLSDLTSRSQTRPTSRCRPGEEISSNWNYSRTYARQSTCTRTNGHVAQSTRRTKANRLSKVVQ